MIDRLEAWLNRRRQQAASRELDRITAANRARMAEPHRAASRKGWETRRERAGA